MTGKRLIDEYLEHLSLQLPPAAVEELKDGVAETYAVQLSRTTNETAAAQATIAEFGHPDTVVQAFIQQSPGRRLAKALLATGPLVGLTWGAVFILANAWSWPIPLPERIAFGAALFVAVGALLTTILTKHRLQPCRIAAGTGALIIIVLDSTIVGTVLTLASPDVWLIPLATTASILRLTFTIPRIPQLLRA